MNEMLPAEWLARNTLLDGLRRAWVNVPSNHYPFHEHHGKRVLIAYETDEFARVYFTSGNVISMRMPWSALSDGGWDK